METSLKIPTMNNHSRRNKNEGKIYLGLGPTGTGQIFRSSVVPTASKYPQYLAAVGPFRTQRGAAFIRDHGRNNPHCRCVSEAERLGLKYDTKRS